MTILYEDIFATALAHHQREAENECLHKAQEAAKVVKDLSAAQLNGLVTLAIHANNVDKLSTELRKRNDKRWGTQSAGPFPDAFQPDIAYLKNLAREVVTMTEKDLNDLFQVQGAGAPTTGRDWLAELHLYLTRRYLTAVVDFARAGK